MKLLSKIFAPRPNFQKQSLTYGMLLQLINIQSETESFERCQSLGIYSLVFLTQALEKYNFTHPMQIGVVSNQIQAVIGDERLCPAKATVLGACKVIPQEFPNIRCRSIDINIHESGKS